MYAFSENFVLPLSHDEVVHVKGSLLSQMPGDRWQQLANLRLLLAYHVGPAGQEAPVHGRRVRPAGASGTTTGASTGTCSAIPRTPACSAWWPTSTGCTGTCPRSTRGTSEPGGFEWIDANDSEASVLTFLRWAHLRRDAVLVACNFTPVVRYGYRVGVPRPGRWREIMNSDSGDYGGSGVGNEGGVESQPVPSHGRPSSLSITLPPLAAVYFEAPPGTGDDAGDEGEHPA